MRKMFIKDGRIRSFEIQDSHVVATVQLNGNWVSNPTLEAFLADGWQEYIAPVPEPYIPTYEEKVVMLIRERYSLDSELAIQRQRESKPEEFQVYFDYCEECKRRAKDE